MPERIRVVSADQLGMFGKREVKPSKPTWNRPRCRECGCTDDDCTWCIARTGEPCMWVEPDLCSACAPADRFA